MATRTVVAKRDLTGLAPPREPIPGAITYEQAPWYSGSWWWWPIATKVSTVHACVRLIAHQCSVMPAAVMRDNERVPDQPGWLRNPAPGAYSYVGDAWEAIVVSLLMRGNAYMVSTGVGSNGFPLGWVVANPDTIAPERSTTGRLSYRWGTEVLAPDDVAHVRWIVVPGSDLGLSPLEGCATNLASAAAMARYSSDLATNGAMPYGVLQTEQRLSPKQATDLSGQFAATGGARRGVLVLDSGLTYQQLQLSPKDMALLELQQFDARAICSVFGVQPWLVNVPTADGLTYNTAKGQLEALLYLTLDPVLAKVEGVLSQHFLPGDRVLRFNRDRFTVPSFTDRITAYAAAIAAGIYSTDEVRAMEGLPAATELTAPVPVVDTGAETMVA